MATEDFIPSKPRPGLLLFGEEWIHHGYRLPNEPLSEPGPCPVCGAPNHTCKGEASGEQ